MEKKKGKKKKKKIRPMKKEPVMDADVLNVRDTGINEEQQEAVAAENRPVAVIAGPGTGKTKTLVDKIAYLVKERNVSPAQITAVTFTNQAAAEMRERLAKRLGGKRAVKDMTIGTFHSICLQLLKQQGEDIILADEAELLEAAKETLTRLDSDKKPKDFLKQISNFKNNVQMEECLTKEEAVCFQEIMSEMGLTDFTDRITGFTKLTVFLSSRR